MSEKTFINLSYRSPYEDIEQSLGFNPNGTINVKFTLMALRDHLAKNLETINKLLDSAENITDIIPSGFNLIEIKTNSESVLKELIDNNILTQNTLNINSEENTDDNFSISDEDKETNNDRLAMINNLTNVGDSKFIFGDDSDPEKSGSDDLIDDEKNIKNILSKFANIAKQNNDSESDENKSDSENSHD